jgi:DUF971 family protein
MFFDQQEFDIRCEWGERGVVALAAISNVVAVGSYALTIVWEDGHDDGIFNWHHLRVLCPCPADRAKYGKG